MWSLRMNANAHLARLLPDIQMDVIKRARKTKWYMDVLIRIRMGYGSPETEKPVSASLRSVNVTFGKRDSSV